MRLFADPHRCPDCGASLPPTDPVCPSCRLDLTGALGQELFSTLSRADVLLARLRERSLVPHPAPSGSSVLVRDERPAAPEPAPETPATARLSAASVPQILLTLGALCLLVAALVFLVVSWPSMGVAGRTATLVALTAVVGGLTAWCAGRALRGATEALGTVTLGLATLDVVGARDAGWLGTPTTATFAVAVGLLLVVAGLGTATALGRTPAAGFTCGELVSVAGAVTVSVGLGAGTWGDAAGRALVAVLAVSALTALAGRVRPGTLRVAVAGLVCVAVTDWLVLVGAGFDRVGTAPSVASVWGRLDGWALVAAAAIAGAVAATRAFPVAARVLGLAAATAVVALLVTLPAYDEDGLTLTLTVLVTVAVAAAATAVVPRPWAAAGLAATLPGSLYLGGQLLVLGVHAAGRYAESASAEWAGTPGGRLGELSPASGQAPAWTVPLLVVVLLGAAWSAARLSAYGRSLPLRDGLFATGLLLWIAVVATLLLHPVPVWLVLLALLATGAGAVRAGRAEPAVLGVGAATLAVAVPLSWYDAWLTFAAVTVALLAAVAVHGRNRLALPAQVAGALVPPLAGGLLWTVGELAGAAEPWVALTALVTLALVALGRGRLPGGHRDALTLPVELSSFVAGLVVAGAGVTAAAVSTTASWTAVYLTVGGTAATLLALLREDRRPVGWLGGALLAAATWVRLGDLGVTAPEPYTLPSAVALLVTGVLHLRRHPGSSTLMALTPGLTLALVPSLLWALEEPLSGRAVLLGAGCLALVLAGLRLRWSAPLVHASVVGALLVLREAGPYVGDSVPRWALIGSAGTLLVLLGATWEQRLQDARAVTGYVRGLR